MKKKLDPVNRLFLPQVTLCAATSVNVWATIRAIENCLEQIKFAECKLFTDASIPSHSDIEFVPISKITSTASYSDFLLSHMAQHVKTSHCLIVQWDGHVLNAQKWRAEFLDYDYIGARWPQHNDGYDVGNGGFSLRSRRLMQICGELDLFGNHAEDVVIGRTNRDVLEGRGMRFAPSALADHFSTERAGDLKNSFGYHGIFNMPKAIGTENFWKIYQNLDDRSTIKRDFFRIINDMNHGSDRFRRIVRITIDRLASILKIF